MPVSASGTARIRHRDTGVVYEIDADELDWEEFAADEREMGLEVGYVAEVDHPELGVLRWEFWEYPLGLENHREIDLNGHVLVDNFSLSVNHVPEGPYHGGPSVEEVVTWFFENYEDPAHRLPYESAEGGYQWIFGGPYDAREVIEDHFPDIDPQTLEAAVHEIEADGIHDWAPAPSREDYEELEEDEDGLGDLGVGDLAVLLADSFQIMRATEAGPVFALDARNQVAVVDWTDDPTGPIPGAAQPPLLQDLRDVAADLVGALEGNNAHPDVFAEAQRYQSALAADEPVIFQLYARGVRLEAAISVAEAAIARDDRPSFPDEPLRHIAALRTLHGAYIMGDEDGRRLVEAADAYRQRPDEIQVLRDVATSLSESVSQASAFFAPSAQLALEDAAAVIGAAPSPERGTQVGIRTVNGLFRGLGAILATGGAGLLVELIGQSVGASAPGVQVVQAAGGAISAAWQFLLEQAPLVQTFAAMLGGDAQWLRQVGDVLAEVRRRRDVASSDTEIRRRSG